MKKFIKNALKIFLPIILGSIVGFVMKDFIDFDSLNQPPLSPNKIVFPIAWSIIYLLMGISYYIYRKRNENDGTIILYYTQLVVNLLWSIIFFIFKWRLFAAIWIILLDILVFRLIKSFFKDERFSAYLNMPYMLWIIFATYLNIGIVFLN